MVKEAQKAPDAPSLVTLVAVSKGHEVDKVREAILCGQLVFGENRVQEGVTKYSFLRREFPRLQLHLIGPLQTNKVKLAVEHFDVIQTLDRPKLAEELCREMKRQQRFLPCFIQVNTGREPQKAGVDPDELVEFHELCVATYGLDVMGLMCIPPVTDDPSLHFRSLAAWRERLNVPHLSMGMSTDFMIAVECGATHVRVGTAIFGARS
jgi:hypothetical protein